MYEGDELKSPEEIIKQYKGVCPQCGNELAFDPNKINIIILGSEGEQ